jgi:hypothetical protein
VIALALSLSVLRLSTTSWARSAPTMQGFNPRYIRRASMPITLAMAQIMHTPSP